MRQHKFDLSPIAEFCDSILGCAIDFCATFRVQNVKPDLQALNTGQPK